MNASIDVQRTLGSNTMVDVGYTWNYSYNQHVTYDANWIPIGTGWPFTPSNLNPTTAGNTSADIGSIFERTIYPGYGTVTDAAMVGHDNLQRSHRHHAEALVTRLGSWPGVHFLQSHWARPVTTRPFLTTRNGITAG